MKATTRSFWLGVVVGGIATLVFAIGAVIVGVKLYARHIEATLDERVRVAPVPESIRADYDWEAVTLGGKAFAGESLAGKTVVLTFWKPDCFSCTEQMEDLEGLSARMGDSDVEFAAVSVGDLEATRDVVAQLGLTLPVYVLQGSRPKVFETSTLPTTFVLTRAGAIAFRYGGIARWNDPGVEQYLRGLASVPALAD